MSGPQTHISGEEYDAMTFSGPEAELANGELIERTMPDSVHSRIQRRLSYLFEAQAPASRLFAYPELRLHLPGGDRRIVDVGVYAGNELEVRYPDVPPLVAIEIVSAADRHRELMKKLRQYEQWGVPHIWVIEPDVSGMSVFRNGSLLQVTEFELRQHGVRIVPAELFFVHPRQTA